MLELKRKQLDLMRVQAARFELELKIEERLEDIERMKEHIRVQKEKEDNLKKEIEGMEK